MTRKEGIQFMPILRAYINDEQLQWRHKHTDEKWKDLKKNEELYFPSDIWEYRIKEINRNDYD